MEKKLDPFGTLILAFVRAVGGGPICDIITGNLPVAWLSNGTAVIVAFSSAVIAMLLSQFLKHFTITLFLFDALGVGLFTITGIGIGITGHQCGWYEYPCQFHERGCRI